LSGSGRVEADGGSMSGASQSGTAIGGGGGRVALYHAEATFDLTNGVRALAGVGINQWGAQNHGAPGTVYLRRADGAEGELRIDNLNATVGRWTPLGQPGDGAVDLAGDHLVISGTNVVVAPDHKMPIFADRVTLWNGALLTHQACTADQVYSLDLTVEEALVIDTASRIDATGRGYLAGRTTGNSIVGGATWPSGGSYGGLGAGSPANKTHGDFREPVEPGSGSSNVAGGGLLRITAGSAVVDGVIRANGANGGYDYPCGGSGGGIRLDVVALSGSGRVEADGGRMSGASNSGHAIGGGGGRVALYYGESTFDLTNGVRALAGVGINQWGAQNHGAPGTV